MQFIYPIGLFALAGLLIPVLIHLWSTKQGKTLKIGSIALLSENSTASSKSFKLTDLLLFILRCLILMLITFMLAQPYFKRTDANTKNKGWILMDKAQFTTVYQAHHKTIDSLLNLGFELHNFNLGFNQFSLQDSAKKDETIAKLRYSALLNQLNRQIPLGYSAHIFADCRLNNFDGNLPKLNFNLVWTEMNSTDTLKIWSTKFLDKVYEGKSTPSLTSYSANQAQDLPSVTVAIYDPKSTDSKYIKAGLKAISDFTKRKIEIKNSYSEADVIFWLSDQPIHSSDLAKFKTEARLFSYQKGKVISVNSNLQVSDELNSSLLLKKRIALDNLKGTAIWMDSYGDPILLKENKNGLSHFHFYSRFDPQWTDLVWDEQFVKALIPIVLDNQNTVDFGFEDHDNDQRLIAKQQVVESKINTSNVTSITTNQNIDKVIWILAFILLIIERIVSFRNKTKLAYVKS